MCYKLHLAFRCVTNLQTSIVGLEFIEGLAGFNFSVFRADCFVNKVMLYFCLFHKQVENVTFSLVGWLGM